ncbi:MAG: trypsin-like serine protease [Micromonosporaceae bacterium]
MRRARWCVLAVTGLVAALTPAGIGLAAGDDTVDYATPESQYVSPEASTSVIGGELASVKDYPHVILGTREGGPRPQGASCTGSVVAPRKVLIAAHCHDASGKKRFLYGLDNFSDDTGGFWAEVVEYKKHPNFTDFSTGYDVAVVTLDRDVPVPTGYKYPRIAGSNDTGLIPVGTNTLFVGYGRVEVDENYSSELRKTTLPVVAGSGCKAFMPSFSDTHHLCTGYQDGRTGICQGDSGGGLMVNGVLVGVASFVRVGCNSYSGFAKLPGILGDWAIKEVGTTPPPPACAPASSDTDVSIPDKGAAVTSEVTVSGCTGSGGAGSKVEVHVKHTWRGDLVVDLIAPDGSVYSLKKASAGDGAVNLDATYTADLSSETANGTWKLRVQDVYSYDTGFIDSWTLTL